jgi:lipopolysaccharide assembly outer membrane protein LptD (OstA)
MNKTLIGIAAVGIALAAELPATAQSGGSRPWNDCVAAAIQARLVAQEPLRLSAEKVNLEGDTLRLTGRAMVRFDDTSVVADEIVINQASKQVELTAVRQIFIGARSRCAPPPSSRPRVEYR